VTTVNSPCRMVAPLLHGLPCDLSAPFLLHVPLQFLLYVAIREPMAWLPAR